MHAQVSDQGSEELHGIPEARLALIERIVAAAPRRIGGLTAALRKRFLRDYYRGVGEEDLSQRTPEVMAAMAIRHLEMGSRARARGEARVQVINPDPARDGFDSSHTVVMVVTDDMPFLLDSLNVVFHQAELAVHLIVHPVLSVKRDGRDRLVSIDAGNSKPDALSESWQLFLIDLQASPEQLQRLQADIEAALGDVRVTVEDWMPMRKRMRSLIAELKSDPPPLPAEEVIEATSPAGLDGSAPFRVPGLSPLPPGAWCERRPARARAAHRARHPSQQPGWFGDARPYCEAICERVRVTASC